jgi:hypothetical protein
MLTLRNHLRTVASAGAWRFEVDLRHQRSWKLEAQKRDRIITVMIRHSFIIIIIIH